MRVTKNMKELSNHIITSHNARTEGLEKLFFETRETLKEFSRQRKEAGKDQQENLSDYAGRLGKDVDDMLRAFQDNHRRMSREQSGRMLAFLKRMRKDTKGLLKDFHENHRQASDDQAKHLAAFLKGLTDQVWSMLGAFKAERNKVAADLRARLANEVSAIDIYVGNRLKEIRKTRAVTSKKLKKDLTHHVNGLTRDVRELLQGYRVDVRQERSAGSTKAAVMATSKPKPRRVAKTVRSGSIEEEAPHAAVRKQEKEDDLEAKVLRFVNNDPQGAKIVDMETALRASRIRLGSVAKKLLEEGRIRKQDRQYFPL